MPDRTLRYIVTAQDRDASAVMGKIGDAGKAMAKTVGGAVSQFAGFIGGEFGQALDAGAAAFESFGQHGEDAAKKLIGIGAAVTGLGLLLSQLGANEKRSTDQLRVAINNTTGSYEDYARQVEETIKKQENFGHSAAETRDALTTLVNAIHDPEKALELMGLVADLAAAKHISLAAAATAVAKVFGGSSKILKQYGIDLEKTGDKTADAEVALGKLSDAVSGQASASVDNFSGKVEVLRTKLGDFIADVGNKWGGVSTAIGSALTAVGVGLQIYEIRAAKAAAASELLAVSEGEVAAASVGMGAALASSLLPLGLIVAATLALKSAMDELGVSTTVAGVKIFDGVHGMFDATKQADDFAQQLEDAARAFATQGKAAEVAADGTNLFDDAVQESGASVEQFRSAITGTQPAWDAFIASFRTEAEASGMSKKMIDARVKALNDLREAYQDAAKAAGDKATLEAQAKALGLSTDAYLDAAAAAKKKKESDEAAAAVARIEAGATVDVAKAHHMTVDEYAAAKLAADKQAESAKASANAAILETGATKEKAGAYGMTVEAYANAKIAADKHKESADANTQAMRLENDAAGLLRTGLDLLNGNTIDVTRAQFTFHDSLVNVKNGIKDNGVSLNENTEAGEANVKAILDSIEAAQQYAEAQNKSGVSAKKATDDYKANREAIRQQLIQMGFVPAEVDKLLAKYAQVPKLQTTKFDVDKAALEKKVAEAKKDIGLVKQDKIPILSIDTKAGHDEAARLQGDIDLIKQHKIPGLSADKGPGKKIVDALQADIEAIKQKHLPDLSADPRAGKQMAAELQKTIDDIKQGRVPGVTADTAAGKQALNELQGLISGLTGNTVTVNVLTSWGSTGEGGLANPANRAAGGPIIGDGGPTADRVPFWGSNGEYVMQAAAVAKYGSGFMANLNAMKFAAGGPIIDLRVPSTQAVINALNLTENQAANKFVANTPRSELIARMFGSGTPGAFSGSLLDWVFAAEAITGTPTSWTAAVLRRINFESGGNPNAINLWDSNAMAGDPSRGLMQTIMSTFQAYHQPGTSFNIYDPVANIAAALNYIKSRYGTIFAIDPPVQGYKNGAWSVPDDGLAFLHQKELVMDAKTAHRFRTGSTGTITIETGAITVIAGPGQDEKKIAQEVLVAMRAWIEAERRHERQGARA